MYPPAILCLSLLARLVLCDAALSPVLLRPGHAPYAASLRPDVGGGCSGAVLHARWLLTAAHCLQQVNNQSHVEVFAGVTDTSGHLGAVGQRRLGDKIILHPSFKGEWAKDDVALVKLKKEFDMNEFVNVIPLSNEPWGNATHRCQVPGFGVMQGNTKSPLDHRLKAHLLRVTRPCQCASALSAEKGSRLLEGWLCSAAGPHSGPCRGDSGAPLVCNGRLRAVTAATFYIHDPRTCDISRLPATALCADPRVLNIFIDIHPYLDWINRTVHAHAASSVVPSSTTFLVTAILCSELLRQLQVTMLVLYV